MLLALGVPVEQAPQEPDERDALELRLPLCDADLLLAVQQRLEPVRVAQRLRRERRDRLARIGTTTMERTFRVSSCDLMLRSIGSFAASGMNTVSPLSNARFSSG